MECKIDDLPDVLLEYILSLVPPYKDLQECKLVSKRWFHATQNVLQHNKAHFHKSVAFGSLLWNPWPSTSCVLRSTIGKRHSHSACTYKNSMYVFGGCTATCTTFNDLWRLDLDTKMWVRLHTLGNYPSPKACATMVYYKKSFILFGGLSHPSPYALHQQGKFFNELHVYSIDSNKWIAVNTLETPPPISAHSASIHKNYMIVFGGICNGHGIIIFRGRSNDIWCLNLDSYSWHKQATSNLKPQPRYGQSQIELGDKHLLVLGGCAGPNVAMHDAWLLKMEGAIWTWRKVNMNNTEWAPARIWCHRACKVGNYIVVLNINKYQNKSNMPMKKISYQRIASTEADDPPASQERQSNLPPIDRDVNVNGRRGTFCRTPAQTAHSSFHGPNFTKNITLWNDNVLSMAAFRDEPVRNSSNSNRQRQLESLRRMVDRIRNRRTQTKVTKKSGNTLSVFVLDITNILCDECTASWIPLKHSNQSGPEERILYSLVAGRGELIVFGGIRKDQTSMLSHPDLDEVYNDLHFINPPRYVI